MTPDRTDTPRPVRAAQWPGLDESCRHRIREAMLDEFPEGASEFTDEVSRRRFLTLMGASLALAGAAGCNLRPASPRKIVPYTTQPDEITPGVPLFFATAAPLGGYGSGVLVRSHEGRPIKVEGNPDHPSSLGGASAFSLASILDLYDPDRSRGVTHRGIADRATTSAVTAVRRQLYDENGQPKKTAKLRILTETVTSPTLAAHDRASCSRSSPRRGGSSTTRRPRQRPRRHREGVRPAAERRLRLHQGRCRPVARRRLPLPAGPATSATAGTSPTRRKVRVPIRSDGGTARQQMNRLYVVESMPTNTGAVADHRLALPGRRRSSRSPGRWPRNSASPASPAAGALPDDAKAWLKPLADGPANATSEGQVRRRRRATTSRPRCTPSPTRSTRSSATSARRCRLLAAGRGPARREGHRPASRSPTRWTRKQVETLLILVAANPAYTAPADLDVRRRADSRSVAVQASTSARTRTKPRCCASGTSPRPTTSKRGATSAGTTARSSIQQPLIAPLYQRQVGDRVPRRRDRRAPQPRRVRHRPRVTGASSSPPRSGPGRSRPSGRSRCGRAWSPRPRRSPKTPKIAGRSGPRARRLRRLPAANDLEINFRADPTLYDGRFANNGWLQEMPEAAHEDDVGQRRVHEPEDGRRSSASTRRTSAGPAANTAASEVGVVELKFTRPQGHGAGVDAARPRGRRRHRPPRLRPRAGRPRRRRTPRRAERRGRSRSAGSTPTPSGPPTRRGSPAGSTVAKTNKTYFLACTQGQTDR